MQNSDVISLLSECLEVEPSRLQPDVAIADVEEWTSLGWLAIMAAADQRWGVVLGSGEIRSWNTVGDVLRFFTRAEG